MLCTSSMWIPAKPVVRKSLCTRSCLPRGVLRRMARAGKTPRANGKRKETDVTTCDAPRCRASHRCGSERKDHAGRRQRFVAKDHPRVAGGSEEKDSSESRGRGLHRQLGNWRIGQRVYGREESKRGLEVAAPDQESQRSSSDHEALHGI